MDNQIHNLLKSDDRIQIDTLWTSSDGSEISFLMRTIDDYDDGLEIYWMDRPSIKSLENLGFTIEDNGDYEGDHLKIVGFK